MTQPGILSAACRQFHAYSIRQPVARLVPVHGPRAPAGTPRHLTRWQELDRQVRRGERALTLCLPVTVTRTTETEDSPEEAAVLRRFVFRPYWFVLAQTDGPDVPAVPILTWHRSHALAALGVAEVPSDHLDGNCLGLARARSIAINPVNPLLHKATFNEVAG